MTTVTIMADIKMTDYGCKTLFNKITSYHNKNINDFLKKGDNPSKRKFKEMKSFYNKHCLIRR